MKRTLLTIILSLLISASFAQTTRQDIYKDSGYFTDLSFSELKNGIKPRNIKNITHPLLREAAQQLLAGTYKTEYRVSYYNAYPSQSEQDRTIGTGSGFSKYENITGMYLPAGENIVMVGDTHGRDISLLAPNLSRKPGPDVEDPTKDPNGWWLHKKEFPLVEGVNIINLDYPCNVYISYFDDNSATAPPVKVHFLTGEVNGYFDTTRGDTNEDWDRLLENAVSEMMDMRGEYIHGAFPVEWLKAYTSGEGVELMGVYDEMLLNHYTILGLVKHGRLPKNRIFARVNYNYYMFRDGDGVAYYGDGRTMEMVLKHDYVRRDGWGFAHEAGHVLQLPEITWRGMVEVSVNIFSNYSMMAFGREDRLKDHYGPARENIIGNGISYLDDPDVFNRLVPFWQLHLYFTRNGYPDFYPDLFEAFRTAPDRAEISRRRNNSLSPEGYSPEIQRQLDFIKTVCDLTQTDLTDFFDKWGFFKTGIIEVDDYGKIVYNVTPEMVAEVKDHIASKNYPAPVIDPTTLQ